MTGSTPPAAIALRIVVVLGTALALLALVVLGIRATEHFDSSWDTVAYHLPFAALRAGVPISFEMSDHLFDLYDGAPPLPELLQGLVWRATHSVSATGLASLLVFVLFTAWTSIMLRGSFWIVVLISLTAPMVLIHATATYVDLITGSFFAIGGATAVYLWLFPERATRAHLIGGLLALAAAFWSKYTVAPFAGVLLLLYIPIGIGCADLKGWTRRSTLVIIGVIAVIAALPYLRNLIEFGNPFWPFRAPLLGDLMPFVFTNDQPSRPPSLARASSIEAFVRSLFEIDLPWEYELRRRWTIDSGGSVGEAFRLGGFWGIGALFYLLSMLGLLVTTVGRRGWVVAAAAIATLGLVALVPQSNELRYWMFIPLMWAAVIGMLFHRIVDRSKVVATAFGIVVIAFFGYMVLENQTYYSIARYNHMDAARAMGARDWWPLMDADEVYCAVGMNQMPFLLTGPTLRRYEVVARTSVESCPSGALLITPEGISALPVDLP